MLKYNLLGLSMTISKLIIPFFCFLLFSTESKAWTYGEFISCDALNPRPIITFKTSYGQLVHDFSTPQKEIQSKSTHTPEKGFFTTGLATVKVPSQIWLKSVQIRKLDENNTCVMPKEIEVTFSYEDPVIYVSSEFDYNSCQFSQILRHEQTHQRINKLTLEYFLPLIHKTLKKTIREVRSIKVPSPAHAQEGMKLLQKYYRIKLTPIIEEYEKARKNEQKKLDNLTNYTMESELCHEFNRKHPEKPVFKKDVKPLW